MYIVDDEVALEFAAVWFTLLPTPEITMLGDIADSLLDEELDVVGVSIVISELELPEPDPSVEGAITGFDDSEDDDEVVVALVLVEFVVVVLVPLVVWVEFVVEVWLVCPALVLCVEFVEPVL